MSQGNDILKIAVIIPAYDAESTVLKVISSIPDWVSAIYVIDDASNDKTSKVIEKCADSRVRLMRHEVNGGVGAAMVTGYSKALEDGVDICIKMDADNQMDPAYLPDLLEPILDGRADYTKGNRFHNPEELKQMPSIRKIGNAILSFLVKSTSGNWHIFDPTNGYTAIHREALRKIKLKDIHRRYFFEISLLCLLGQNRAVVEDVPIPARYGNEKSHLSIGKNIHEFLIHLVKYGFKRIMWQYFIADFNATSLFLVVGLVLFTFGIAYGSFHWIESLITKKLTPTGTIMIAVLAIFIGFQLLLQAIVTDISNIPKKPLQKKYKNHILYYKEKLQAYISSSSKMDSKGKS